MEIVKDPGGQGMRAFGHRTDRNQGKAPHMRNLKFSIIKIIKAVEIGQLSDIHAILLGIIRTTRVMRLREGRFPDVLTIKSRKRLSIQHG